MKRMFRAVFSVLLLAIPLCAVSTPQTPDVLVMGGDTLTMFSMPLESAPAGVRERLRERLDSLGAPMNTACWRRYVGHWLLLRDTLWLESVCTCAGEIVCTGAELLPEYASGTRAWAPWAAGEIRCGSGEEVCTPGERPMRRLEHERVLTLRGGRVTGSKTYENRAYRKGFDAEENMRRFRAAFDPARSGEVPAGASLHVRFVADSTGRVVRIERARLYCTDANGTPRYIEDRRDPLLREALRAFRAATRWDGCWIEGAWAKRQFSFLLSGRE